MSETNKTRSGLRQAEKKIGFEEALKRMEKIIAELESGKMTLEEAVKKYEQGIKLSSICSEALDAAKRKVEVLIKKEGGSASGEFDTQEFKNSEDR